MAVFDFSITIPDSDDARVIEALRTHLSIPPEASGKEVIEAMRQEFIRTLRSAVKNVERDNAVMAANEIALIDAT